MKKLFVIALSATVVCSSTAFASPGKDDRVHDYDLVETELEELVGDDDFEDDDEYFFPTFEQTASAVLDRDGNAVKVTVDLSDGWSAEFAPGAVYLSEGSASEDVEADAIGLTLDKEVFDEYQELAVESDSYREYARCFSYVDDEGHTCFFYSVGPDAYFMIQVWSDEDPDEVSSRFAVEPFDVPLEEVEPLSFSSDAE